MKLLSIVALSCCLGCGLASAPRHGGEAAQPSAQELYDKGLAFARAGDHIRAGQYVDAAIAAGYPPDRAALTLVQICVDGSQLRAALLHAEPHLLRHPDDAALRYLVASIHFGLEQPQRARDELMRLSARSPGHAEAHYLLGVLSRDELRDPREARRQFKRYLELDPRGAHVEEAVAWLVELPPDEEPQEPERLP